MEIVFKELEVTKLNLEAGDVLAMTIKSEDMDQEDANTLVESLRKPFPDNQVVLFVTGPQDEIRFSIIKKPEVNSVCE